MLRYEELRGAIAGNWDGRMSLHGLGILMGSGMAAWIHAQVEVARCESATVKSRWNGASLPATVCGDVVGILAEMALAATVMEDRA